MGDPRSTVRKSLRLLAVALLRIGRLAVQPEGAEGQPSDDGSTNTSDPGPGRGVGPAARPLVVGDVPNRDGVLLLDVVEERSLVVHLEVEDAVLVRQFERGGVRGAVLGRHDRLQVQSVERGKHAELKLQLVGFGNSEGDPSVPCVFGEGDRIRLFFLLVSFGRMVLAYKKKGGKLTTSLLMR